ncbi:MAG TPA: hypothetical protein PLE74_02685 [Candidatus Cloacimonadota bacterium]|nr:hypothetical protein [Candidatus Cloacimonadota bacterium]HPT71170.1 hypothetical protein [Candidatus Cloacimonadota bacterium]
MTKYEFYVLRKLIAMLLLLFIIIVIVDNLIGYSIIRYVQFKRLDTYSGLEYAKYKQADVLILGASQAEVGYNSDFISKRTGLETVNLAISSSNCIYSYMIVKDYLLTHKLKYIIYDASYADLQDYDPYIVVASRLDYLYKKDKSIDSILAEMIPYANVSLFFKMHRYHRLVLDIFRNKSVQATTDHFRVFAPDNGKLVSMLMAKRIKQFGPNWIQQPPNIKPLNMNSLSYRTLQKLINLCRENHIQLVIIHSPSYYFSGSIKYDQLVLPTYFKKFKNSQYVSFVNISTVDYPYLSDIRLFRDFNHVNRLGSDSLSSILAREIIKRN